MIKKTRSTTPGPIERHVGKRLAGRRRQLGLELKDIDAGINAPTGTTKNIEAGEAFIGLDRLRRLAITLDVTVSYFFKGIAKPGATPVSLAPTGTADDETIRLVEAYYRIPDIETRKGVLSLLKSVAEDAS